jgi:type IV pilus assembly protein PilA
MYQKKGFTLIELLVVIAILGILAVIALPRITTSTATAKTNACLANIDAMNKEIEMYYADHGSFPTSLATVTGDPNYFPSDAPTCPSGGNYSMDSYYRCHCSTHGP